MTEKYYILFIRIIQIILLCLAIYFQNDFYLLGFLVLLIPEDFLLGIKDRKREERLRKLEHQQKEKELELSEMEKKNG